MPLECSLGVKLSSALEKEHLYICIIKCFSALQVTMHMSLVLFSNTKNHKSTRLRVTQVLGSRWLGELPIGRP